ncbi:MAG: hypothetical protein AAFR61_31860 [Bacteroidota bacterium]
MKVRALLLAMPFYFFTLKGFAQTPTVPPFDECTLIVTTCLNLCQGEKEEHLKGCVNECRQLYVDCLNQPTSSSNKGNLQGNSPTSTLNDSIEKAFQGILFQMGLWQIKEYIFLSSRPKMRSISIRHMALPHDGVLLVSVFNLEGTKKGGHQVTIKGGNSGKIFLPSPAKPGIYYVQVEYETYRMIGKMLIP